MPMPDTLKSKVWVAVHDIERTVATNYPKQFKNIDAAKEYIKKICHDAKYDYHLPFNYTLRSNDPHHIIRIVKYRACFLVAVRAHNQGEFYIDKALPDRRSLRVAIESDIARAVVLVRPWPTEFCTADVAAKYVAGVCALQKFQYTRFEGVAEEKFRSYVTWNTARREWETGRFGLKVQPKSWVRKEGVKKSETMTLTEAVESDIARLMPLIQTWPAKFKDLNQARNFVGQWCFDNEFKYLGCSDVALHRYCLFVNFNTAKNALEDGLFEVDRAVRGRKVVKKTGGQEGRGNVEQKDEVKIIEFQTSASKKAEDARLCSDNNSAPNAKTMDTDDNNSNDDPSPSCTASLSETTYFEDGSFTRVTAELGKQETAAADPFKDLVAELQRRHVLRAAFE